MVASALPTISRHNRDIRGKSPCKVQTSNLNTVVYNILPIHRRPPDTSNHLCLRYLTPTCLTTDHNLALIHTPSHPSHLPCVCVNLRFDACAHHLSSPKPPRSPNPTPRSPNPTPSKRPQNAATRPFPPVPGPRPRFPPPSPPNHAAARPLTPERRQNSSAKAPGRRFAPRQRRLGHVDPRTGRNGALARARGANRSELE